MDKEQIQNLPKILLHDHLDGGLRTQTLLDLAEQQNYPLPATTNKNLTKLITQTNGSLEKYLTTFQYTTDLMQTPQALHQIAKEAVIDLANDNVIYAEIRYAPLLHTKKGLKPENVVNIINNAINAGMRQANQNGTPIQIKTILTAMRNTTNWQQVAELVDTYQGQIVGFDIAGPENGYPASNGIKTLNWLRNKNHHLTIHAGEDYGTDAIKDAVHNCGAERLGHGVKLIEDKTNNNKLYNFIRDRRITLELCPTSNINTGAIPNIYEHPFDQYYQDNLRVTINTDNRLMSQTSMTNEIDLIANTYNYNINDIFNITLNAAKAAFIPHPQKVALINNILKPQYKKHGHKQK